MKKRLFKSILCLLIISMVMSPVCLAAETPYYGYNYDADGASHASINGFYPTQLIKLNNLGEYASYDPVDMFVQDQRGELYIVDQTDGRILVLDRQYRFLRQYDSFSTDKGSTMLNKPSSLFVESDGTMYIADTENHRVLVCDTNGRVKLEIGTPATAQYVSTVTFAPNKILVDQSGSIYVIVRGITQGALVFSRNGQFKRYFGSNEVSVNLKLMTDWLWKRIMNDTQRSTMSNYVPVEFLSFDVDSLGFIYTVSYNSGKSDKRLSKFNFLSDNVVPSGRKFGDLESVVDGEFLYTRFVDVSVDEKGYISALDLTRGRVFRYDSDFQPLFVLGGKDPNQFGCFDSPAAVDNWGSDTLVLDNTTQSITVFSPTEFGTAVESAIDLYNEGDYSEALEPWRDIARMDENFRFAYRGMADGYYMLGDYTEAMKNYKLADDQSGYLKAFRQYRTEIVHQYFYLIFVAIGIALALLAIRSILRRRVKATVGSAPLKKGSNGIASSVRSPFRVLMHPVAEYERIAYHRNEPMLPAAMVLVLYFFAQVLQYQYTGFGFNSNSIQNFNVLLVIVQTVGVAVAFIVINWLTSSLMEGKGFLRDVFVVIAYALLPYILVTIATTLASNLVVTEEYTLVQFLYNVGIAWSALQLVIGLKAIHDYSVSKTILSILISIAGLVVVAFIVVLSFAVYQQVANIVLTMFNEVMFRL